MVAVVARGGREHRVQSADQRSDTQVAAAEGERTAAQKEETDGHMDCHVVTVVHVMLKTLSKNS